MKPAMISGDRDKGWVETRPSTSNVLYWVLIASCGAVGCQLIDVSTSLYEASEILFMYYIYIVTYISI